MEKIGTHNYEAFFLDYVEGNLSIEQEQELKEYEEKIQSLWMKYTNFGLG